MLTKILTVFEPLSKWSGKVVCWITAVLIAFIVYDVGARYIFSAPTKWSYELSYMLGGSLILLAGAYVLLHRRHVRVDVLYSRYSPRTKQIIDVVFALIWFFPVVTVLLYASSMQAWSSWLAQERSNLSYWNPYIYPFKAVIPVAFALLLLQGVATFIGDLTPLIKAKKT